MSRKQLDRALQRAATRDRKRRPGMKVTGREVFRLREIIRRAK